MGAKTQRSHKFTYMEAAGESLRDTELRLGLPGTDAPEKPASTVTRGGKRALPEDDEEGYGKSNKSSSEEEQGEGDLCCQEPPAAK